MLAEATVQTSGIDWVSVITIIASSIVSLSVVIGCFAKIISDKMTNSINKFRIDVVNQLDNRLTAVETKLNDIRAKQGR